MKVPDVLQQAGDHLNDAQSAWTMMRVAALVNDEVSVRQFSAEAEAAAKHAQALFDEYLTFGDVPSDTTVEGF